MRNVRGLRALCALVCAAMLIADLPLGRDFPAAKGEAVVAPEAVAFEEAGGASAEEEASGEGDFGEDSSEEASSGEATPGEVSSSDSGEIDTGEDAELPGGELVASPEAGETDSSEPPSEETPALPEESGGDAEIAEDVGADDGANSLAEIIATWMDDLNTAGFEGDYARALWLYDRLIANFERGEEAEACAALRSGSGAPLGYARAYAALLAAAGIECKVVEGGGSAWNIAKLDGAWTQVDACMDDAPDCYGTHFGLSDAAMARDHSWEGELPACEGSGNSYFVRERGYLSFEDREALRALLLAATQARTEELLLYNAGGEAEVAGPLRELLAEIAPTVEAEISEKGCYAAARLRYAKSETTDFAIEPPVKAVLGAGESIELRLAGNLARGEAEWTASGAAEVAQGVVTAKSLPKGKKSATAKITATAPGGAASASVEFKIVAAPTKLTCEGSAGPKLCLGLGERRELTLTVGGYAGGDTSGSFYQLPVGDARPGVVRVDEGELPGGNKLILTGEAVGSTKLSVRSYNGKSAEIAVDVLPMPERIELPGEAKIAAGEALTLRAALADAEGQPAYAQLSWSEELLWSDSGEPSGFTIRAVSNEEARIQAPKAISPEDIGRTLIVRAAAEGYAEEAKLAAAECRLIVANAPVGGKSGNMLLELSSAKLGVGETATATFRFAEGAQVPDEFAGVEISSNKSCVRVSAVEGRPGEYLLEAKKTGKATITAKSLHNGQKVSAKVSVVKAPKSMTLKIDGEKNPEALTMGVGERFALTTSLSPGGSAGRIDFRFEPEGVAEVQTDEAGKYEIVALAVGEAELTAVTYNGVERKLRLRVMNMPRELRVGEGLTIDGKIVMSVGMKANLGARLDEGSAGKIVYEATGFTPANRKHKLKNLLSLDDEGNVSAKAAGTVQIRVSTYEAAGLAPVKIELVIKKAPEGISFDERFGNYLAVMGGPALNLREHLRCEPEDTNASFSYRISFAKGEERTEHIAIAEDGSVTPLSPGKNTVVATTHNKKSATATIWVVAAEEVDHARELRFDPAPPASLDVGKSYSPALYVFPADARTQIRWSVSNPGAAAIDENSGKLTQKGYGFVTITAADEISGLELTSGEIAISSKEYCLTMPVHRTDDKREIAANLKQIDAVKNSALRALKNSSAANKSAREAAIERAFKMFRFAWTPSATVPYWSAANSMGGRKNFRPGTYYFGMPYTQNNRVNSSLSSYTSASGDGYSYRVTTGKFNKKGRGYPGNDCSSFASMAVWGFSSNHRGDDTRAIYRASYYSDVGWNNLQPGDLICRSGRHVVMFLYYVGDDKSRFVVIEQGGDGGGDPYVNCVSTAVRKVTQYKGEGYKPRRPKY